MFWLISTPNERPVAAGYDRAEELGVHVLICPKGAGAELQTLLLFTNLPLLMAFMPALC